MCYSNLLEQAVPHYTFNILVYFNAFSNFEYNIETIDLLQQYKTIWYIDNQ